MSLVFWNGVLLFRNGLLAKSLDCCCEEGCCQGLGDMYARATVGTCSATDQLVRQADGTYAGSTVRLWTVTLSLPGNSLFIAVQCWDGGDQIRIYSDTCSGIPANFDLYDPSESGWNVLFTCTFPINFPDHPGACYDPSCGSPPPLPFSIQINNSPY